MAKKVIPKPDSQTFNRNAEQRKIILKNDTEKKWAPITKYALFLGFIAFFLYANTLQNGYALDDLSAIQSNSLVRKGITAIPEILSTPYHYGSFRARENGPAIDDLYRPLSLVIFAIEYQFLGDNPMLGHLVNLLLYAGCVILFFIFLYNLFKRQRPALAFIGALLFALHPIHTEVVANIKSADELLCFFFGFLSLNTFMKYLDDNDIRSLISGLIFYFLSLLSKETSITFLAVIPFVFFFYRNEDRRRSIYISLLCLLPVILFLVIRFSVLISYRSYNPSSMPFIENALKGAPSMASRLATEILVLGYYLKLLIIPYPLICDYSFNAIPYANFSNPGVLVFLFVYLLLIFLGVYRIIKKRNDPLAFGIIFFLITISIFSNILFLLASEMAERFMFFASAGFCVAIAFIVEFYLARKEAIGIADLFKSKLALGALIPISLVFIAITIDRNTDWKDSFTLFQADSKKSPDNCRLYYFNAGEEMAIVNDQGADGTVRKQMLTDAIINFQKCVSIYPDYGIAQSGLADAFSVSMQLDSAEFHGEKALKLIPYDPTALNILANIYLAKKKYPEAIVLLKKASIINPSNPYYTGNLGTCNMLLKQYDSAIFYFRKSVNIDPGNIKSVMFLSVAFNAAGQKDSAKKYEAIVKQSEPGFSVDKIPLPK